MKSPRAPLGAEPLDRDRCRFLVWAPRAQTVEVVLGTERRAIELEPRENGYFEASVGRAPPGTTYTYRLDGRKERADPASRFQPQGIRGPSAIVDSRDQRRTDDDWKGVPLSEFVIYELHVGTFTNEGTLDAAAHRLPELRDLGITAVELMPIFQFPGDRNWGYDGVLPFAVQDTYGGPEALHRFVDAAHAHGLAVVLDVVYNHFGPEGSVVADFGPYFTDRYRTPWGAAINLDGPQSDEVRRYFIENALYWFRDFRVDALRLDAAHELYDRSAKVFLEDLSEAVARERRRLGRPLCLIAEDPRNDARMIRARRRGGYGLDAQWTDDLHHAMHVALTGETHAQYEDYRELAELGRAWLNGFAYIGQYSRYMKRRHGTPSRGLPSHRFIVSFQNHDQVGNRPRGDRAGALLTFEQSKLAAASILLSPYTPLLFMGEEYGETNPFLYFTSHNDPALVDAVRQGRREMFSALGWGDEVPDPQDPTSFHRSKLDWQRRTEGQHKLLLEYYRNLIALRRRLPSAAFRSKPDRIEVHEAQRLVLIERAGRGDRIVVALNFDSEPQTATLPEPDTTWKTLLDSAAPEWAGPAQKRPALLVPASPVTATLAPQSALLLTARFDEAR